MSQSDSPQHWLNKSLFKKIIEHHTNEKLAVTNLAINSGAKPGESLSSDLYRASVTYANETSEKTISLILKTIMSGEDCHIDGRRFLRNETKMYDEVLVDIDRLIADAYNIKLFPSLIYQSSEPPVIVLEDLRVIGFTTLKAAGDIEMSKMIFQRLAMFHAASFCLAENGVDYSTFDHSVYHMTDSIQEAFFRHNLKVFKDLMQENAWPKLNKQKYIDKVDDIIENCTSRGQKACSPVAGGFNVLNHGDFFMRNILFRGGDGEACDLKFLDFQMSLYASPAIDIYMALYGSMTSMNRKTHRPEILRLYHETFVSSLKVFGCKTTPPTLENLNDELTRCGAFGAQLCICYLPYLLSDWSQIDSNINYNINDDVEIVKRKIYKSKKFAEVIEEEFEDFFDQCFI